MRHPTHFLIHLFFTLWNVADWLYSRIPVRFTCSHVWKITEVEEETESCRYLVRLRCKKCGSTSEHRRP